MREKYPPPEGLTNDGERGRGGYSYDVQGNGRHNLVNNRAGGGSFLGHGNSFFSHANQDRYQRDQIQIRNGGRGSQRGSIMDNNVSNPTIR